MKRKAEDSSPELDSKRIKSSETNPTIENFLAKLIEIYENIQGINFIAIQDLDIEDLCKTLLKNRDSTLQAFYFAILDYKESASTEALELLTEHPLFLNGFEELTPLCMSCMSMICHTFEETDDRVKLLILLLKNHRFIADLSDYLKNYKTYHLFSNMIRDSQFYQSSFSALEYPLQVFNQMQLKEMVSQITSISYKFTIIDFWSKILNDLKCKDSKELKIFLGHSALAQPAIQLVVQGSFSLEKKMQFFSASMFPDQCFFNALPKELGNEILANLAKVKAKEVVEEAFACK